MEKISVMENTAMKNRNIKKILLVLIVIAAVLIIYSLVKAPTLKGFYQSELVDGYTIQLTIDKGEKKFIEYIDNRDVNSGTYTKNEDGSYEFNGKRQDFKIHLNHDNTFHLTIQKLNGGQPILLKNISKTPAYFTYDWDDLKKYRALLN
ncbi:MAG: hypothetical protein RR131_04485 [Anaerovorax sp.]